MHALVCSLVSVCCCRMLFVTTYKLRVYGICPPRVIIYMPTQGDNYTVCDWQPWMGRCVYCQPRVYMWHTIKLYLQNLIAYRACYNINDFFLKVIQVKSSLLQLVLALHLIGKFNIFIFSFLSMKYSRTTPV